MPAERGFTLIEVLVALVIGASVILLAHAAFASTTDLALRLDADRADAARTAHARRALENVFGSLVIGPEDAIGFDGGPDHARFTSEGRRSVTIRLEGGWLVMRDSLRADSLLPCHAISLDYLLSYGAQATWVRSWQSPVSAPLAARLRLTIDTLRIDTLMLIVGPRG